MNGTQSFDLEAYSQAIAGVIESVGRSVVVVKSAGYQSSSGVVIRENAIAVNSHALRREGRIPVRLHDGSEVEATLVGREPGLDLAVLSVSGGGLKALQPEPGSNLRPGAHAIVVGRTLDVGLSASVGIVGAVGGERNTWRGGKLNRFLRLDVNVYPSQTGAAVVSATGNLIGMATPAILRHAALAVPPETLNRVAAELLKEGRVRRGYLGTGLQPVAIPEHLQSKTPLAGEAGLMVLSVEPGTGADHAGIQLGDILVAANGTTLLTPETLMNEMRGDAVGKPIRLTVLRSGSVVEIEATVSERSR